MSGGDLSRIPSSRIFELDGIRGLAAILVLVFHVLATSQVSGGVDVLIFLSGFFFSTLLLKDSSRLFPHRLITYLSRLAPTAALVLLFVMALAFVDLNPKPTRTLLNEVLFSAVMIENWFLGFQAIDYLDNDGWQSLVQHFWAVSVQVQLFALFSLVIHLVTLFAKKSWVRSQWLTLGTLSGLSLIYSAWMSFSDPTFAYFDTFARAWEFGVGAMVGLLRLGLPSWLKRIRFPFASFGVVLILATGVFVPSQGFPFPSAIVPITGIIFFTLGAMRQQDSLVKKALRARLSRFIGSLSYPIYLWHWPIHLIVSDYFYFVQDSFFPRLIIVSSITLCLSWVTIKVFEKPALGFFRTRTGRQRSFLVLSTAGFLAILSLGVNSAVQTRDSIRYAEILHPFESFQEIKSNNPIPYRDGCHLRSKEVEIPNCVYGNPNGEKSIFLIGGSHAASWQPAVDKASRELGWRLIYATKSNCRLTLDSPNSDCADFNRGVVNIIKQERPDLIISTSTVTSGNGQEVIPEGYLDAWKEFSTYGIDFLMIRDIPRWERDPVNCVERFPYRVNEVCAMKASERMASEDPSNSIRNDYPNFTFVDFTEAVCPGGICLARDDAGFTYRDDDHFTKDFSVRLSYLFLSILEAQ